MFGLSFLYPLFLLGAAAAAIPVVLHLFRRKTDVVVDFPAVRLLQRAPVEQQRRRRVREWILLALRVSALLLLAFAFARPYTQSAAAALPLPVTVVALDTSLSLSAPGQFEQARQAAHDAVTAAPATHAVALLTFSDAATVVVAPTQDRAAAHAAVDQAQPSAGGTRYRTALSRAAEIIPSDGGRIVIVTDLQQAGWEAHAEGVVPDGIDIDIREVPAPSGNVAVTAVRRDGDLVIAGLHNFGARDLRVPARLRVDGKEVATQSVDIAAQAAAEVRLSARLSATGAAEVRVDDADGYAGDNVRYLVLGGPTAIPVIVVTAAPPEASNAGLYVERALSVAEDGRAFEPRVIDGRAFSTLTDAQFGTPGGVVLLGTSTLDRTGRERLAAFLQGGGRVLLTLGPDVDTETLGDIVGQDFVLEAGSGEVAGATVTLVAADTRHPIFRPFVNPSGALGDVYVERFRRLKEDGGWTVLARFSGAGNALVERSVGDGRLLVFASDLDNAWNRFPLNPAFVPWVMETARYLAQGRDQRHAFTLPDVPPGVPAAPGVHQLGDQTVAVNADVRESNPARQSAEEFTGGIVRGGGTDAARVEAAAREREERQRLWQIGLVVMFLALAGEGLIGRRAI